MKINTKIVIIFTEFQAKMKKKQLKLQIFNVMSSFKTNATSKCGMYQYNIGL